MDSSSNGYNFKWNTYSDHLKSMLHSLFTSPDFTDVTIVCDDQKQMSAHKAILSYCSPALMKIIQNNPHPYPLIYLRGVKYETMQSLLNFLYVGEASLAQDNVNEFLSIAKELEIKELCNNHEKEKATEITPNSFEDEVDNNDVKKEATVEQNCSTEENETNDDKNIKNLEILNRRRGKKRRKTKIFKCKKCGVHFSEKATFRRHFEAIHNGVKYPCSKCDLKFTQKYSVQKHMFLIHNEERNSKYEEPGDVFRCKVKECGQKFRQAGSVNRHYRSKHLGIVYPCKKCKYVAKFTYDLKRHMDTAHD